jgi:acyl-CoA reductase-like NAD-dependent aldehyde dehydrogenase
LYKKFIDAAAAEMKAYKLGNPLDTATSLGPMALPSAVPFLKGQVDEAVAKGAKVIVGGDAHFDGVSRKARFFAPTLLADANHSMNVVTEESFGPILPVQAVESDEHAVQLMNESQYGLTAAVFTKDTDRFDKIAARMQCGTVYMNRWEAHNVA